MRSSVVIPSTTTAVSGAPLPKMNKEDGWNRFADIGRAVLIGGLRRLCARDCRWIFLALSNIDGAGPARCARFLARVERALPRFIGPSS